MLKANNNRYVSLRFCVIVDFLVRGEFSVSFFNSVISIRFQHLHCQWCSMNSLLTKPQAVLTPTSSFILHPSSFPLFPQHSQVFKHAGLMAQKVQQVMV